MKRTIVLLLTALTLPAYSQVCPPCEQDLLGYECSGGGQPHMVLGDNDGLTEARHAATFSVAGTSGSTTIGNVTISFVIGSSNTTTKFVTDGGGECVGTSGVQYPGGFPPIAAVAGRALTLSGRNPLYCHEPTRDLICFSVKGQVGPPFPLTLQCAPDRIELACGVVS
jgi:hypothetical protein